MLPPASHPLRSIAAISTVRVNKDISVVTVEMDAIATRSFQTAEIA